MTEGSESVTEKIGPSYQQPRQSIEGPRPGWRGVQARRAFRMGGGGEERVSFSERSLIA